MIVDLEVVETNIFFSVTDMDAAELVAKLRDNEILMMNTGLDTIRAVTHLYVNADQIEQTLEVFARLLTR